MASPHPRQNFVNHWSASDLAMLGSGSAGKVVTIRFFQESDPHIAPCGTDQLSKTLTSTQRDLVQAVAFLFDSTPLWSGPSA